MVSEVTEGTGQAVDREKWFLDRLRPFHPPRSERGGHDWCHQAKPVSEP